MTSIHTSAPLPPVPAHTCAVPSFRVRGYRPLIAWCLQPPICARSAIPPFRRLLRSVVRTSSTSRHVIATRRRRRRRNEGAETASTPPGSRAARPTCRTIRTVRPATPQTPVTTTQTLMTAAAAAGQTRPTRDRRRTRCELPTLFLDHFSRVSQHHTTPHAPCAIR